MGAARTAAAEEPKECAGSDHRKIVNAIFYVLRTGMPWRDLPARYGPYTTAYNRFNRWSRRGIWKRASERLALQSRDSLYLIDSTVVKAHRAASGAKGGKNQAIGVSRGGRTTKIHAVVDSKGRPLSFTVTGGQVHDSQVVEEILNTPRSPLAITADKAYDSERSPPADSRTKVPCRSSRAATPPSRKPIVPSAFIAGRTNRKLLLSHQGWAAYRHPL